MLGLTSRTSYQCRAPVQRLAAVRGVSRPAGRMQLRATAEAEAKTETKKKKKDAEEEEFSDGPEIAPSTAQVQAFLNTLCAETDVAQVELKIGSFSLKVRRSIESAAPPAPAPAPAAPAPSPAATLPAAAAPVVVVTAGGLTAEESMDEALVYVTSPKVGIFRRGKYAAGKRIGKGDMVKPGDTVRAAQTVAFVEQLGTFVEVKTSQAGEVVKFKVNEGDPVEYGQVVMELAPFFGVQSPAT